MAKITPTRRNIIRQWLPDFEWSSAAFGFALGLLAFLFINQFQADRILDFLDNLVPEFVGIIFTVLILDRLDELRELRQVKEQLVRRVHSRYNHTALEAIEELRVLGYLTDGTLAKRELRGSNWQNANLYKANLNGSDLRNAKMQGADFVEANLKGTQVTDEQLATSYIMHGATMPDGKRYDGRYNLPGDFDYARRNNVNLQSQAEMAEWFGVSLVDYMKGQEWARDYLPKMNETRRSASSSKED